MSDSLTSSTWRGASTGPHIPEAGSEGGKPATVWGATLFQWVNPKAWIVIATFVTAYVPVELGCI
jgi:threonine/homoserine/homoserine lactone efflux protein